MTSVAEHWLLDVGPFDLDDLPYFRAEGSTRLCVDAQATDTSGHELVVTVRVWPADGASLRATLVDTRGKAHDGRRNERGQVRFSGLPPGPWRFVPAAG